MSDNSVDLKRDIGLMEKNVETFAQEGDLKSVVSKHTVEYDLFVAKSNPEAITQADGHKLRQALDSRHVSMIALGGALGYVEIFACTSEKGLTLCRTWT